MKSLLIGLVIFSSFAVAKAQHAEPLPDQVSVVGFGEIEAAPDKATLSVSVVATEANIEAAKQAADDRYKNVLAVIKEAGIDEQDVKVTHLSIHPVHEWRSNKQEYKGERVSRALNIVINDLDKLSSVLQALVHNGVSTVDGLRTGFKDQTGLRKQALAAAALDAKQKAVFLAKQFDRDLGTVLRITEQNSGAPIFRRQDVGQLTREQHASFSSAPTEALGLQKINASINATFKLE